MPVFHQYSESYHKSGYYVNVNWSAPHPYPLQTPGITEQIYLELGFEPDDDIPNELTSRLFNAGLHWTEGNGSGDPAQQTDVDSLTTNGLPELTSDQLDRLYELLDRADTDTDIESINQGALSELKDELDNLQTEIGSSGTDGSNSEAMPDQTVALLNEYRSESIGHNQAAEIRATADLPDALDKSLRQFTRSHPITPHDFVVNEHGTPTYRFQTGPVEWELSDCRLKDLGFDWAVRIAPETDRTFGIRISSSGVERTVSSDGELSNQQAADLISIVPDLLWTFNLLGDYTLSSNWNTRAIQNYVPSPRDEWLEAEVDATLDGLTSEGEPDQGVIVDLPNQHLGRARTLHRRTVCIPVAALPNNAEVGSEVTFDIKEHYGTYSATNISVVETADGTPPEDATRTVELTDNGEEYLFKIPDLAENDTDDVTSLLVEIVTTVDPAIAAENALIQECFAKAQIRDSYQVQRILGPLLADTPFTPSQFPSLVDELDNHKKFPDTEFSFRTLPVAFCVACFYERLDAAETLENVASTESQSVLYKRDSDCLIVGTELLWDSVSESLRCVPTQIRDSLTDTLETEEWNLFVARMIGALGERHLYATQPSNDGLTQLVLSTGIDENGLETLYLSTGE